MNKPLLLALALIAGATLSAAAAERLWTAGGADGDWETAGNWSGGIAPAATDTVVFANAGVDQTNRLTLSRQIASLAYSNTPPGLQITDLGGFTLTVTNSLRLGYGVSNSAALLGNGVLQLGSSNAAASLLVGYNHSNAPVYFTNNTLTIAATIVSSNWGDLRVSGSTSLRNVQGESNRCVATLDLSQSVLIGPGGSNRLEMGILRVGGFHSTGFLKLPPAVTAIEVGQFWVPGDTHNNEVGYLDLGEGASLRTLRARNGFHLGHGGAGYLLNWPTNVDLFVGSPTNYVTLSVGNQPGYGLALASLNLGQGSLTAYLTDLNIGKVANFNTSHGTLDLSSARVQIGDETNKVKVANLIICGGGGGDSTPHYGTLLLPREVTDLICNNLELGHAYNYNATNKVATLDFGTDSALTNLVVSNSFLLGEGARVVIRGFPTSHWSIAIGTEAAPARFRAGSRVNTDSSVVFAPTGALFRAHLSQFAVAENATNIYGKPSVTVDLRRVTVSVLAVTGNVTIAASATAPSNRMARGAVFLPACDASFDRLFVGNAYTSPAPSSAGLLSLSGTRLEVVRSLFIGSTGIVSNRTEGVSGGIDLLSEETNDLAIAGNGILAVRFGAPPAPRPGERYCWGLRMAGHNTAHLQSLLDGSRIRIDTSELDSRLAARAGVHYSAADDRTYIGLPPASGALMLLR